MDKLNDEQRDVVQAAMSKASEDFFAYNRENDALFGDKLVEEGYTILRLNDEDQLAMASQVQETIWPLMAETVGQEIIDRLLASMNQ